MLLSVVTYNNFKEVHAFVFISLNSFISMLLRCKRREGKIGQGGIVKCGEGSMRSKMQETREELHVTAEDR